MGLCYTIVLFVNGKFTFFKMQFSSHRVMPHWPCAQLRYLCFFCTLFIHFTLLFYAIQFYAFYPLHILRFTLFTHTWWCTSNHFITASIHSFIEILLTRWPSVYNSPITIIRWCKAGDHGGIPTWRFLLLVWQSKKNYANQTYICN